MIISNDTKPSLDGSRRIRVSLEQPRSSLHPQLDLAVNTALFHEAEKAREATRPIVEKVALQWGIDCVVAERLLRGELQFDTACGRLTLFVNADELARLFYARLGLVDGAQRVDVDDDHWAQRPTIDRRLQRIAEAMEVHARHGSDGARGSIGGRLQLTELLCDLRLWCAERGVNLLQCLDMSYERYMHERHRSLSLKAC
jgi:hypothetical protein